MKKRKLWILLAMLQIFLFSGCAWNSHTVQVPPSSLNYAIGSALIARWIDDDSANRLPIIDAVIAGADIALGDPANPPTLLKNMVMTWIEEKLMSSGVKPYEMPVYTQIVNMYLPDWTLITAGTVNEADYVHLKNLLQMVKAARGFFPQSTPAGSVNRPDNPAFVLSQNCIMGMWNPCRG